MNAMKYARQALGIAVFVCALWGFGYGAEGATGYDRSHAGATLAGLSLIAGAILFVGMNKPKPPSDS